MARLFPSTLHGLNPTVGEERVFAFLKRHLLPDEDHLAWYKPELPRPRGRARHPHFVLLGPRFALLVLEVNDWLEDSIVRISKAEVILREPDGRTVRRPQVGSQARAGAEALIDALRRTPGLTHPEGLFAGNLVVPVNAGVVFPNLTHRVLRELRRKGASFRPERCLAREDLELTGEEAAKKLLTVLTRMYVHRFPFRLDEDLVARVRVAIEPQLHFFDLREGGWEDWAPPGEPREADDEEEGWDEEWEEGEEVEEAGEAPEPEEDAEAEEPPGPRIVPFPGLPPARHPSEGEEPAVEKAMPVGVSPDAPDVPGFTLDPKQERIARELASPRTLVYGPAGSGKTVFLISRAQYWVRYKPDTRVLFTCYNASLASYLRRAFRVKGLPPDGERLTVHHYHELLARILDLGDIHERGEEFYAGLEPRVLAEMTRRDDIPLYDLILVDEGQDFSRRMLEVLVRLLAGGGEITVVCDPAQDIYRRWSPENLAPLRDHAVEHLIDCYRNTAPIFALARAVLAPEVREEMGLDRLEMTRPEDVGRDGPAPELTRLAGLDDLTALIAGEVEAFRREGRPLSQLAVLYPDRRAIPGFPARLRRSRWKAKTDARFFMEAEDEAPGEGKMGTLAPGGGKGPEESAEPAHFAEALERELTGRGIPAEWVARDFTTKAAYDIGRDRLTVSTVHSAKGMDFHTVILLGADSLEEKPGKPGYRSAALLFTGITRARERLVAPYFEETGWVPGLRERIEEVSA